MLTAIVLSFVLAASPAADLPWYSHYDRGLALIEEGRAAEAREHLEAALRERSEPGRLVRTYGLRYVDYLPHLYLAVANHMSGEMEIARSHLKACERWAVAEQTDVGATLLSAYRLLLVGGEDANLMQPPAEISDPTPGAGADAAESVSFRDFDRKDVVLGAGELRQLRQEISERCGLPPETQAPRLPWYFHYEMGLALSRRGDPQRALDALIAAADRRPVSQHGARMYGMWFTDYLPYYAIARAHGDLGNWECALSALEVSGRMGEIGADDEEYAAFRTLMEEARSRQ